MPEVIVPPKRVKGFQHYKLGVEFEIGLQGEMVFKDWLEKQKLPYTYWEILEPYTNQTFDFQVNGLTIDVKTTPAKPYKKWLIVNVGEVNCDFYVAVKLPDKLKGFATKHEILRFKQRNYGYGRRHVCRYSQLRTMRELEEILRRGLNG